MVITKRKIDAGEEIDIIYEILEDEMQARWRFVSSIRRQYLDDIKRILANQYVLTM